jgi:cytochrome c oxidase subunit 4
MSEDVLAQSAPHEAAHEAPSTSSYVKVWALLLALLVASIGAGFLGAKTLSATLVFGIAAAKAALVLAYFMHLRLEPRWIAVLMLAVLGLVAILLVGLMPDILHVYGG